MPPRDVLSLSLAFSTVLKIYCKWIYLKMPSFALILRGSFTLYIKIRLLGFFHSFFTYVFYFWPEISILGPKKYILLLYIGAIYVFVFNP